MDNIKIIVGGKEFNVNKSILNKSKYFKDIIENVNFEQPIIIDRSPKIFKHIIELLKNKIYPFPIKYKYELDFYLIENNEYLNQNLLDKEPEIDLSCIMLTTILLGPFMLYYMITNPYAF